MEREGGEGGGVDDGVVEESEMARGQKEYFLVVLMQPVQNKVMTT